MIEVILSFDPETHPDPNWSELLTPFGRHVRWRPTTAFDDASKNIGVLVEMPADVLPAIRAVHPAIRADKLIPDGYEMLGDMTSPYPLFA